MLTVIVKYTYPDICILKFSIAENIPNNLSLEYNC